MQHDLNFTISRACNKALVTFLIKYFRVITNGIGLTLVENFCFKHGGTFNLKYVKSEKMQTKCNNLMGHDLNFVYTRACENN